MKETLKGKGSTESDPEPNSNKGDIESEYLGEKLVSLLKNKKGETIMEICSFSRSIKAEHLINWIRKIERYVSYERIGNHKKTKFAC